MLPEEHVCPILQCMWSIVSIALMQQSDLRQCLHQYCTGMVCDGRQGIQMVMQGMAATVVLGWQRGEREVDLMNGILLLHDMHTLASVHILLQHPHLAGPSPLQHHRAAASASAQQSQQVDRLPVQCADVLYIGICLKRGRGKGQGATQSAASLCGYTLYIPPRAQVFSAAYDAHYWWLSDCTDHQGVLEGVTHMTRTCSTQARPDAYCAHQSHVAQCQVIGVRAIRQPVQ